MKVKNMTAEFLQSDMGWADCFFVGLVSLYHFQIFLGHIVRHIYVLWMASAFNRPFETASFTDDGGLDSSFILE
jgi:hypothetical protein